MLQTHAKTAVSVKSVELHTHASVKMVIQARTVNPSYQRHVAVIHATTAPLASPPTTATRAYVKPATQVAIANKLQPLRQSQLLARITPASTVAHALATHLI